MTTPTEALKLAIDTQDAIRNFVGSHGQENTETFLMMEADRALSAVRSALAQQQASVPSVERAFDMLAHLDTLRAALSAEDAQPVAWVLTEQLEKRETTCNGRLWFSDPVNSAWTPLYAAPTAQAAPATAPADELMAWRLHFDNVELRAKWDAKLPGVEPTDRDLSAFAVGTEVGFKQARDFERQDWSAAWHALKRAGVHPGRTYDRIEEVIDRLAAERDALKAAAQPAAPAPVVQPLPADLIEYMRGHLMRERRKLDGFVSVGNELPRAAKYDRWLAAMEGDTQAAPVVPAGRLHTDGYFTWNRRDGYVLDQKLPCDFYLAAAAPQPPAAPAQAGPIPGVTTDAELAGLEAAADAAGLSVEWYELRLELQHLRTARQAVGEAFEKWRDRADPEQMAMMLASPTPPQPVEPTP